MTQMTQFIVTPYTCVHAGAKRFDDVLCHLCHPAPTPNAEHPMKTPNTTILALDLGTHTGWALHQLDGTITSGTEHFTPKRFEGGGMRYLRFKRWLNELLSSS